MTGMTMAARVDRVMDVIKWPFAVCAVLLLPGAVLGLFDLLQSLALEATQYGPFLGGAVVYYYGWKWFFRRRIWGSMLSTLEHELTHALFGLFTFRMIRELRVSWDDGGHVTFPGRVNWLILIAPYWFPTATFVLLCLVPFFGGGDAPLWLNVALGVSVTYHLTSTWVETHVGQSDLQRVGFPFAWCVLPFLNVWAYGVVVAMVVGGVDTAGAYNGEVFGRSLDILQATFS